MILATLRDLAKTLGCRADQADDVVRSEPSAHAALSRRGMFKAAGAVAAGTLFADVPKPSLADLEARIDAIMARHARPMMDPARFTLLVAAWQEAQEAETMRVARMFQTELLVHGHDHAMTLAEQEIWQPSGFTGVQLLPRVLKASDL